MVSLIEGVSRVFAVGFLASTCSWLYVLLRNLQVRGPAARRSAAVPAASDAMTIAESELWPSCRPGALELSHEDVKLLLSTTHSWEENWDLGPRMTNPDSCLQVWPVLRLLAKDRRKPQLLPLDQVCHKPMHMDGLGGLEDASASYCGDPTESGNVTGQGRRRRTLSNFHKRIDAACPLVPGIVAMGAPNPCGARYRMLDGRHRVCKLKRLTPEQTHAWFYVVTGDEVLPLVRKPCQFIDEEHTAMEAYHEQGTAALGQIVSFFKASYPRSLARLELRSEL